MNTLDALDAQSMRTDLPDFRAGDTLKVHARVVEGNRSRVQVFQGVVIARQGAGLREARSRQIPHTHAIFQSFLDFFWWRSHLFRMRRRFRIIFGLVFATVRLLLRIMGPLVAADFQLAEDWAS